METYTVTVNGKACAVTVEENAAAGTTPVAVAPIAVPAPAVAPAAAPAPAVAPAGVAGSVRMAVPIPSKVVTVKSAVGQAVRKGDVILVLGAMRMENGIVAPQDGTIASISISTSDPVESDAVLATLN